MQGASPDRARRRGSTPLCWPDPAAGLKLHDCLLHSSHVLTRCLVHTEQPKAACGLVSATVIQATRCACQDTQPTAMRATPCHAHNLLPCAQPTLVTRMVASPPLVLWNSSMSFRGYSHTTSLQGVACACVCVSVCARLRALHAAAPVRYQSILETLCHVLCRQGWADFACARVSIHDRAARPVPCCCSDKPAERQPSEMGRSIEAVKHNVKHAGASPV